MLTIHMEIIDQTSMLTRGMEAYATPQYARLFLDEYIKPNRENDKTTVKLTLQKGSHKFLPQ